MHDNCIEENAKWREKAGFDCYLVRDAGGGCCPWCAALEGRYEYASAPDDIFRRHDNCTCTVTYECGKMRQDFWSKRTWEASPEELQARKDAAEAAKPTVNTPEQAKELEQKVLAENPITKNTPEQAKAIDEQSKPTVNTSEQAKEIEAKALGKLDIINQKSLDNQEQYGIIKAEGYIEDNLDRKAKLQSVEDDVKNTNPHYKPNSPYGSNCQRCVPTYALRRKGYDVEALPVGDNINMDNTLSSNPSIVWEKAGNPVIPISSRGSKDFGKSEIEKYMESLPEGAMCEIRCTWNDKNQGHVFVAEKINERIRYIDPQTGEMDVSYYFANMKAEQTSFWRIDNATIRDDYVKYCCKNKRGEQNDEEGNN